VARTSSRIERPTPETQTRRKAEDENRTIGLLIGVIGPLARSASDLAIALDVLAKETKTIPEPRLRRL
jgi:Asp-tRNA(Asn)/Glu-tRNA(Gln) amidotransferase A subunit family amidase